MEEKLQFTSVKEDFSSEADAKRAHRFFPNKEAADDVAILKLPDGGKTAVYFGK